MIINNLPTKYLPIWEKVLPLFDDSHPGDLMHAKETVEMILAYKGEYRINYDILVPVAMIHDVGHIAILPEHIKYVTGKDKIANAKLVHMLTGAKIAKDILQSVGYDEEQIKEIVEIISIHDFDQLKDTDIKKIYNTENKRLFHDFDSMDRYTEGRIKNLKSIYPDRRELLKILESLLDNFFYDEFRHIAKERFSKL